jgi:hypothetical protein
MASPVTAPGKRVLNEAAHKLGHWPAEHEAPAGRAPSAAIQAATDDERDVVAHALARWRKKLFVALARNAATPIEHFDLPRPRTAMTSSEVPM